MSIRQFLFNYLCVHSLFRQARYLNWNEVSSVMLLYELDDRNQQSSVAGLMHKLTVAGKKVTSIGYCAHDALPQPLSPTDLIIGQRNLNLLHQPKSEIKQWVQKHPCDVLIDLTRQPVLPLQYIAMLTPVALKVGTRSKPKLYDIVLQTAPNATVDYIFQQILHYLQIIKSTD